VFDNCYKTFRCTLSQVNTHSTMVDPELPISWECRTNDAISHCAQETLRKSPPTRTEATPQVDQRKLVGNETSCGYVTSRLGITK